MRLFGSAFVAKPQAATNSSFSIHHSSFNIHQSSFPVPYRLRRFPHYDVFERVREPCGSFWPGHEGSVRA